MKVLKWVGLALAGVLVLLFVLAEGATRIPAVQESLARRVQPFLGPGIHVDRIGPSFWPGPGVALLGVRVQRDEKDDSQRVLTADAIDLTFAWGPLWDGDFELATISVDTAQLDFSRDREGHSSLTDLVDRLGGLASQTERSDVSGRMELPAIWISDTEIRFVDHYPGGFSAPVVLSGLSVDLESSKPGETALFEVSFGYGGGTLEIEGNLERDDRAMSLNELPIEAQVRGKRIPGELLLDYLLPGEDPRNISGTLDLDLDISGSFPSRFSGSGNLGLSGSGGFEWFGVRLAAPIALSAEFDVTPSDFQVSKAQLKAAEIAWDWCAGQNLVMAMSYANERLDIGSVRMDFFGSDFEASGGVEFGESVSFRGKIESQGVQMPELERAAFGSEPSEMGFDTLDTHFDFAGRYREGQDLLKQLSGSGHMRLEGGQLPSGSVIGAVGSGLLSVIPKILKPKGTGGLTSPTHIEFLDQNLSLGDGVFSVSDLSFVTDDYHLAGRGEIRLNGDIHLDTEITFTSQGMQKLLVSVAVPIPTGGIDILPPFPVAVRGRLPNPIFLPDVAHIPFMAVQIVFSPLKGAANMLFGGIRRLGSGLAGGWSSSSESSSEAPSEPSSEPSSRRSTRGARS